MFDRAKFLSPHLTGPLPAWEYHAHTRHSDGAATMREMVDAAIQQGIRRLIFTEHTEPDLVGDEGWFRRYADELHALRSEFAGVIELVLGVEAPALDFAGTLLLTEEMAREAEFILAAVHAYPGEGWNLSHLTLERAVEIEYRTLRGLMENPRLDAIAHPGGVCNQYVGPFPMALFEEIAALAAVRNVAMELNPAYQKPMGPYLEACRRQGALISPGSNAHHPHQIGQAMLGLAQLQALG